MATIQISEAEAARDFAGLLKKMDAGDEVLIDRVGGPAVVMRASEPRPRKLSEMIERAEARTRKRGYKITMDADFATDMEEILRNRKPSDRSAWD